MGDSTIIPPTQFIGVDASAVEDELGSDAGSQLNYVRQDTGSEDQVGTQNLPFGGDIMAAMRAGDRAAIRVLMAARDQGRSDQERPTLLGDAISPSTSPPDDPNHVSRFSPIGSMRGGDVSSSIMTPSSQLGSPEPSISYGAPFPYEVGGVDGRTVSAHTLPAGGQHGLGLQYIRGRLLRMAPPIDVDGANEGSMYVWDHWRFWRELAFNLLVATAGPLGALAVVALEGWRGAENRGFLPRKQAGTYISIIFSAKMLTWLLVLPLLLAAVEMTISDSETGLGVDGFAEVAWPLLLLSLHLAVNAASYAFIPSKELDWRKQNRRDAKFLMDEQLLSWASNLLSERALQWELRLADMRHGGGLEVASFEFLAEQSADEPLAMVELRELMQLAPPVVKRRGHGRYAERAEASRQHGVPLRLLLERLLRFAAGQRTGKKCTQLSLAGVLLLGLVHAAVPYIVRAATPAENSSAEGALWLASVLLSCGAMTCLLANLLFACHDLRRRQLLLDILAHTLQLGGRRHPSVEVHRFPLLVQVSCSGCA